MEKMGNPLPSFKQPLTKHATSCAKKMDLSSLTVVNCYPWPEKKFIMMAITTPKKLQDHKYLGTRGEK